MLVGFTINKGSFEEDALSFLQSKFSIPVEGNRHSLLELLKNPRYVYYAPVTDEELIDLPFTISPLDMVVSFYRNISDQKLEIPYNTYDGHVEYRPIESGGYIFTSHTEELQTFIDRELITRTEAWEDDSRSILLELGGNLLLEDLQKLRLE